MYLDSLDNIWRDKTFAPVRYAGVTISEPKPVMNATEVWNRNGNYMYHLSSQHENSETFHTV
jgi:hypothetical protein